VAPNSTKTVDVAFDQVLRGPVPARLHRAHDDGCCCACAVLQVAGPNGCTWNPAKLVISTATRYCCKFTTPNDFISIKTGVQSVNNDYYRVISGVSGDTDDVSCIDRAFEEDDVDTFKNNFNNSISHIVWNQNFKSFTSVLRIACLNTVYDCQIQRYFLSMQA
jgi:hypothetical protein